MADTEASSEAGRLMSPGSGILRAAAVAIVASASVAALSLGGRILVPLVEALLIWFVVNALGDALRRLPRVGSTLSESGARWLAAGLVALIGLLAVYSSVWSLASLGPQALRLQTGLDPLVRSLSAGLGQETGDIVVRALDVIGLESLVRQFALGLLGLINQFGLVAIYVAFLLVDQIYFPAKLRLLFPNPARHASVVAVLTDLRKQIGAYLWIMTKVSAATAGLSLVAMLIAGLENPFFWALLVFALNFIPTIGSILGTLLPAIFALVQFQDVSTAALLAVVLGAVQFGIGNILLPRMAGQTLNLSLTVTVLCLFVWGMLWGATGMLLAVPLTASLLLIASRFETTRVIAIAFSRTGYLSAGNGPPPEARRGQGSGTPEGDIP